MTIAEAVERTDAMRPNQYTLPDKIKWLDGLDGQIWHEVVETHEGAEGRQFAGYSPDTDTGTELLVPEPYALDVYVPYLQARMDRENGEIIKWNQSVTLYNAGYAAFRNWYNRTHLPRSGGGFRF